MKKLCLIYVCCITLSAALLATSESLATPESASPIAGGGQGAAAGDEGSPAGAGAGAGEALVHETEAPSLEFNEASLISTAEYIFKKKREFYKPNIEAKTIKKVVEGEITLHEDITASLEYPALPASFILNTFFAYFNQLKASNFLSKKQWLTKLPDDAKKRIKKVLKAPQEKIAEHSKNAKKMAPFVEKLVVPGQTTILFMGDLHGSVHSLLRSMLHWAQQGYLRDDFTFKDNVHFVMLGDMTDRGLYGIEVVMLLLKLKLKNWNNVTLIRGNHEDGRLTSKYGFNYEIKTKYKEQYKDVYAAFRYFCSTLPIACFLGSSIDPEAFIQCCHGGVEPFYQPNYLLNDKKGNKYDYVTLNFKDKIPLPGKPVFRIPLNNAMQMAECPTGSLAPAPSDDPKITLRRMVKALTYPVGESFQWGDFTGLADGQARDSEGKEIYKRAASVNRNFIVWGLNLDRGAEGVGFKANEADVRLYFDDRTQIKKIIRGHQDQHSCCKLIKSGSDAPVDWLRVAFSRTRTTAFTVGFNVERGLPNVITMSSAAEGRGNYSEGYGILTCNWSYPEWTYRIYENPVFQNDQARRVSRGYVYVQPRLTPFRENLTVPDDPADQSKGVAHWWVDSSDDAGISEDLKRIILDKTLESESPEEGAE